MTISYRAWLGETEQIDHQMIVMSECSKCAPIPETLQPFFIKGDLPSVITVTFDIADENGTIFSGVRNLPDHAAVEQFIDSTLPLWTNVLRQGSANRRIVTTTKTELPDEDIAKMLGKTY
jgi:hypothetical protein